MKTQTAAIKTKHPPVSACLYIGATKEAVECAREVILRIIAATTDTPVACEALKTLRKLCEVKNTTVTNCTFTTK